MGQQVERIKILYYNKYNTFNSIIVCINTKEGGMCMTIEKRRSKRTDVSVEIYIRQLGDNFVSGFSPESVEVHVIDISQDGIAFKSDHEFKKNSYYDTVITLSNKETIATVIEIVRELNNGDKDTTYGCRFIGISPEDRFKISVYQIVDEAEKNAAIK